jgi:hypothetical protein
MPEPRPREPAPALQRRSPLQGGSRCRAPTILYFASVGGLDHLWPTAVDHFDASSEMLAFFDMQ